MTPTVSSTKAIERTAHQPYARSASTVWEHAPVDQRRVSTSRWGTLLSLLLGDIVGALLVIEMTHLVANWMAPAYATNVYDWAFVVVFAVLSVGAAVGLYQRRFMHPALEMQRAGMVLLVGSIVAGGAVYLSTGMAAPTALVLVGGLASAIVVPVCRALMRIVGAQALWWGVPAIIISSNGSGRGIMETLTRWPEIGLRPVAYLSDTPVDDISSIPIQGGHELAPHLASSFDIPYVIVALPALTHDRRCRLVAQYSKFFDHVFVVPDSAGTIAQWTTGHSGDGLFGYGVRNVNQRIGVRLVKRVVDLAGAVIASVVLAPIMAVIALFILIDAPGAVFYRQRRMGQNGQMITILKFRTMYEDAEQKLAEILEMDPARRKEYERYHKLKDDPRVTRVGSFLRRYSLDELPQLLNVLQGTMSLVGPRAYMPSELSQMDGLDRTVLQCAPGVTGLWQVSGRNHLSFSDRVRLDVHYLQNWSPWLDLYLLLRTIPVVISGDGAS